MASNESDLILEMKNIDMFFPGVKALKDVTFNLKKGEIHSLMGENGAGKSTLVKVLTGVYQKTNGSIRFDGEIIEPKSPKESQEMGISTVYQEVNLCSNLTVAENIYIGREPRGKFNQIDWQTMNKNAKQLLHDELGIDIDVTKVLDFYPVAMQQMIAIARAIDTKCKILILDEPTSSLSDRETERLFQIMRNLKNMGISIIFISHFLEQIYTICDRVTILRDGTYVGAYDLKELPRIQLISKMMGKEIKEDEIDAAMKVAGNKPVYWMNVHADRVWAKPNNNLLTKMAKKYKNLKIIDWNKKASGQSSWFYSDNIHPKGTGAEKYAALVANSLTNVEKQFALLNNF